MRRRLFVAYCVLALGCAPADETGWARETLQASTQTKVVVPSPSDGDWLGFAIDIDGDTMVVGAHGDDTRGRDAGAAHVYVRGASGWTHQATLTAADGTETDYFGWDVAVSGNTIVVGARRDDARGMDFGSAYVFVRSGTTWLQQQKLYPSDGVATDRFGWSVDVEGDTALIGAVTHDGPAMDSGAAYVFVRSGTTWTQQAKLTASDGTGGDFLGQELALDGNTALVGADEDNVGGTDSGSAYVFVRSGTTWTQQAKLAPSDSAAADFFANGVGLDGDTALIGAWGRDDRAADAGGAYVFVRSGTTWTQQAKLTAPDAAAGDNAGRAVALTGDVAIVASFLDDDGGVDRGAVYVYQRTGTSWAFRSETTASDGAAGDQFGWAVATDGVRVAIGAPYHDAAADSGGAAYTYSLRGVTPPVDAGTDAGPPAEEDAGTPAEEDAGAAMDAGAGLDAGTTSDSGTALDAATPGDGGSEPPDADTQPTDDGGSLEVDSGTPTTPGGDGCSCAAPGASRHTSPLFIGLALATLCARRRRST